MTIVPKMGGFLVDGNFVSSEEFITNYTNDQSDAKRWRALLNSQRLRILGSSGLGSDDYQHFGVELWSKYPECDGLKEKNDHGKEVFTKYVDTIIKGDK